jgi:hypothetical protein
MTSDRSAAVQPPGTMIRPMKVFMAAMCAGTTLLCASSAFAQDPGAQGPGGQVQDAQRTGPDSLGADWGPQQDEARAGVRQGRYIPLGRVLERIRRRTPGSQLDAGLEQWNGRAVYRVRWAAANGRRIDYIVDAVSGAILSADGG